jgi:hypothetical protein
MWYRLLSCACHADTSCSGNLRGFPLHATSSTSTGVWVVESRLSLTFPLLVHLLSRAAPVPIALQHAKTTQACRVSRIYMTECLQRSIYFRRRGKWWRLNTRSTSGTDTCNAFPELPTQPLTFPGPRLIQTMQNTIPVLCPSYLLIYNWTDS